MRRRIIIFAGFLNSGKTSMINKLYSTSENIEEILLFQCEEGQVELVESKIRLIKYKNFKDFRSNFIRDLEINKDLGTVFIEYNGTWSLSDIYRLNLPNNIVIEHVAYFMDIETSLRYLENMSNMILEQMNYSDTICLLNGNEKSLDNKVTGLIKSLKKDTRLLAFDDPSTTEFYTKLIKGSNRVDSLIIPAVAVILLIISCIVSKVI